MSKNTIYIIVAISLLHFVVAIVFLLRKLSGPAKRCFSEGRSSARKG